MAKNDFNMSFAAAFKQNLNGGEAISGTGSLRFMLPDKRTVGTVALRAGKIEALEITRRPNHILQRLLNNTLLAEANRQMLEQKFKNNPDSPLVPDFARQYMMLPDQVITDAVKEHFLGVLDEMMTWNAVKTEWKSGADDRVLTMPLVSPDKLIDLGERRAQLLQKIADECTIEPQQLETLKFRKLEDVTTDDEDVTMILGLGSGEYTPLDLYRQCGIIPFNSIRELHQLWLDKVVDLVYADQFPLSRPAELDQDIVDASAAEVAAEAAVETQPIGAIQTAESEPEPEALPEFDAVSVANEPAATDLAPAREQFLSPFDDDEEEEIFAADEVDDDTADEPVTQQPQQESRSPLVAAAISTPQTSPVESSAAAAPAATAGNLASGVQDFLRSVQGMKDDAQASWDEVVARDEEIEKVQNVIREQQEYLDRLTEERQAWHEDFEAKRTEYEQTVAYLREHLN